MVLGDFILTGRNGEPSVPNTATSKTYGTEASGFHPTAAGHRHNLTKNHCKNKTEEQWKHRL